jgi:LysM repeat protein
MDRRQLAFIILLNAAISLVIALAVAWFVDARRPDLEQLAAQFTPMPPPIMAATATPVSVEVPADGETAANDEAIPVAAADDGETIVYIVQAGDSLSSIATRYSIPLDRLVEINGLNDPNYVFSGQRLVIPAEAAAGADIGIETAPAQAGNPQITALENPGDLAREAVLIVNESDTPVDLVDWRLERVDGPAYTFDSLPLFAGSSVRVYSTSGDDNSIARYWGENEALWSSGAEARLVDETGTVVQSYTVP